MIRDLTIALTLISVATSAATVGFKADAGENVHWQFKPKPRSGVKDVSVISLDWEPSSMVESSGGLQQKDFGVLIKSGEGEFEAIQEEPRLRGGKYLYDINIVPCEEQHIRFSVRSADGETAYFDYPETIPASNDEEIASSSFELSPAQDGNVVEDGDQLTFNWSPSKCASSYLLTGLFLTEVEVSGTSYSIPLSNLTRECGQYEVSVTSVKEEKYSQDSLLLPSFSTPPPNNAVDSLEVKLEPSQNSLTAKWNGHESLPCVKTFTARLCDEGGECQPSQTLAVDQGLSFVEFNSQQPLIECSRYSLFVRPEYPGTELNEKSWDFSTKSPDPDDISARISSVTAVMNDQSVLVSWQGGKCVSDYNVYQKAVNGVGEWEPVSTSQAETQVNIPGVPCTQYNYAVSAVIDGKETEMVEAQETVLIPLMEEEPFIAAELKTVPSSSSVEMTWDHPSCVQSYRLVACPQGQTDGCKEEKIEPESGSSHVTGVLEQLEPCTDYQLDIFATSEDKEMPGASSSTFRTEAPKAVQPDNFSLHQLDLSFEPVQCATKYKVYEKVGDEPEELIKEIVGTSVSIDSPPACSDRSYAVAAVVEDTEGPKTDFLVVEMAPKNEEVPSLQISDGNNDTIEVDILAPNVNMECEVELYEVRYHSLGEMIVQKFSDGDIVLTSVDNKKVDGRIKYLGHDWSPWSVSEKPPKDELTGESQGLLVPVVIVVLLVVVILVTIIFFIVRKKRKSQDKYNCDNGDKSETKKLNGDGDP